MLLRTRPLSEMGAPPVLKPLIRRTFQQDSRNDTLTVSSASDSEDKNIVDLKKTPPEQSGSGFIINAGDAAARVAHLEHSVRFLQEQHRLMLSGLHTEIEALRERNRDLQFQLIFNKESSPKTSPASEEVAESTEEANLKREVSRLEKEAAAARGEARAAEARALQLQRLVDAQAEKLREVELQTSTVYANAAATADAAAELEAVETRAELRARLSDAERLVRRLRADADRQRRELQCMKNSLHASLRASGLDYGYQHNYHFPPVRPEFWREPHREDYPGVGVGAGRARRPLTLPELAGQQIHRSTIYANHHTRPRANYEHKNKKVHANGETLNTKTPDEPPDFFIPISPNSNELSGSPNKSILDSTASYPELKVVVTKMLPFCEVPVVQPPEGGSRARPRRHHHRKQATDHT